MRSSIVLLLLGTLSLTTARQSPARASASNPVACFITGSTVLPAEVANGVPALLKAPVTCDTTKQARSGIPDVSSGGIAFSTIDFAKSKSSPLAFALAKFATPCDPKTADLAEFRNQLNDYLAVEVGLRSQGTQTAAAVAAIKVPNFFLQFQIARITGNAGEITHQQGKVLKNAVGATAAEKAEINALAAT